MTRILSIIVAFVLVISFSANVHAGQSAAYIKRLLQTFIEVRRLRCASVIRQVAEATLTPG